MNNVKRYYVGDAGLVEGESLGRINVVLGSDYDQLVCKVGNMVCAERQMDEVLEIARDDLVIFKGALSALGEASKKLVVCARTTGGTAGPDQALMDACAGVEGVITLTGVARAMNEFERMQAERDALQLLLNDRDEQLHTLEQSRRDHFDNGVAAERRVEVLTELLNKALLAIKRTYQAGRDRIIDMGGDCDGVEYMMNSDLTVQEIRTALKAADEACQFPQSCTARCDCDIPDFSPGNGNKARRRAETLHGFKIVEDPTLAPGEMKLVQPAAKADDPFSVCVGCFGSGTVSTGITEASSTICNECNGTGREQSVIAESL